MMAFTLLGFGVGLKHNDLLKDLMHPKILHASCKYLIFCTIKYFEIGQFGHQSIYNVPHFLPFMNYYRLDII